MRKMLKNLMGIAPPPVKLRDRAKQKPVEAHSRSPILGADGEPIEKTAKRPNQSQEL